MGEYPRSEVDRAMKVQEVIMRAISGELLWLEAAEILGISCRSLRRWKWRYEQYGYDGLFDRRHQRPSPRRDQRKKKDELRADSPGLSASL